MNLSLIKKYDLLAITETWLRTKSDEASIAEFTLTNYAFIHLPYLTRVPYHVDVGCYLTIQTKLLYLLSGGSVLLASFISSFAGTSGRFPSGGPELSCLLHSL